MIDIIFENIGKVKSITVDEQNQQAVAHWQTNMTSDDAAKFMGKFYE